MKPLTPIPSKLSGGSVNQTLDNVTTALSLLIYDLEKRADRHAEYTVWITTCYDILSAVDSVQQELSARERLLPSVEDEPNPPATAP